MIREGQRRWRTQLWPSAVVLDQTTVKGQKSPRPSRRSECQEEDREQAEEEQDQQATQVPSSIWLAVSKNEGRCSRQEENNR